MFAVYHARGLLQITTYLCPFPDLFLQLLLLFPFFSFLKTRLVWFCLNLVISTFQIELVLSFSLNCTSLSLNLLRIYFWFCCLETPYGSCPPCLWPTAYYHLFLLFSDLFSALAIAFPLFLLCENKTCMVFSKLDCFRISIGTYSMFSP